MFVADPVKIHDVLKNLLENASHYSPSESVLELSANIDDKGKNILLSVRDRGSGIPDMDLPRVFERFYRVEQSRARNPGGTGLGLAIVKHLIGLHDGKIDVVNRPGGGSVFTVYLPRKGVLSADSIDETFHHQAGFRA
jgi:signal transduction histidine kinase